MTKVRAVRRSGTLYFDIYSNGYDNGSKTLVSIPMPSYILFAKAYSDVKIVTETYDVEVIVCSVDLVNNI